MDAELVGERPDRRQPRARRAFAALDLVAQPLRDLTVDRKTRAAVDLERPAAHGRRIVRRTKSGQSDNRVDI
jgi:hypothetical protein